MPGIFGLTNAPDTDTAVQLSNQMATALKDEAGYQTYQYTTEGTSLGRVGLSIIQPEAQPAWNESHTVAVVLEGEIYDDSEKRSCLQEKGHKFISNSQAELFAHLYEETGENFVPQLNGAFVAAIWDQSQQKLLLVNDHMGLQPLYYTSNPHIVFAFAAGVRALLGIPYLSRLVDRVAIAQFLTFDHVLDDRTFLQDIKLLPAASVLKYANGNFTIRRYWQPRYPDYYPVRHESEYQEEFVPLMRKAVLRRMPGPHSCAVLLSGGLDSRVVIGLLHDYRKDENIQAFTFGIPNCDDVRFAKEVSARLGLPHRFYPLNPDYLINKAMLGVRLTDGMDNVIHMQAFANATAYAQRAQVIYKGFLNIGIIGEGICDRHWVNYSDTDIAMAHFDIHREQNLIRFDLDLLDRLLLPHDGIRYSEAVFTSFSQAMRASQAVLPADQRHYFDTFQLNLRMILYGVELIRSQAHVRLPYADKDLVEFVLTVPPAYREGKKILKNFLIRQFPDLAKIPQTETNYPLVPCMREVLMRLNEHTRWWLRNKGLLWVVPSVKPDEKSYARYDDWMRTELRSWLEEILLSKRTAERGLFNSDFLETLIADHMAGQNHFMRLGALITIELWHRQFMD